MQRQGRVQRTAAQRGFILLSVMTVLFAFAMNAQQNIVTNYFHDVLGLQGPQFGYITAIREIPGFLLIFLTALFYRVSLQRVTAGALVLLAVGYTFFGASHSFWTVAPWVILSSMGYHTVLQAQYALGLSMATEERSGAILGKMAAIGQGGTFAALIIEATVRSLLLFIRPDPSADAREQIRLRLGRWLSLALEFELAADILRTAIAPTWKEIGQLAAIAALRTVLNYFLQQEIDRAAVRQSANTITAPSPPALHQPDNASVG